MPRLVDALGYPIPNLRWRIDEVRRLLNPLLGQSGLSDATRDGEAEPSHEGR